MIQRETCKRGHPWTADNIHTRKDGRQECRTCHRECQREHAKQRQFRCSVLLKQSTCFRVKEYARAMRLPMNKIIDMLLNDALDKRVPHDVLMRRSAERESEKELAQ